MKTDKIRKQLGELIKKPVAILTLAAVVITIVVFGVYVSTKKQVTIQDGGTKMVVTTFKHTVKDLFEERNINLRKEDAVSPSLGTVLTEGMKVNIKRAIPITVYVDGKSREIYTTATKLKDALSQRGIALGSYDKINMPLDAVVFKDMYVVVTRVNEKTVAENVDIPFVTETRENDNMERGQIKVLQEGQTGKKQVVTKITYENGKEVARNIIEEKVLKSPISKIVQIGTLGLLTTSRGETFRYREVRTMVATAYDNSIDSTGKYSSSPDYGITATGMRTARGVIAVDPRVIPLGTRLYVEGYGPGIAADTGGAIKGNIIDVFFPTAEEVNRWGRRYVKVYILK